MTCRQLFLNACLVPMFLGPAVALGQVSPALAERSMGDVTLHIVDSYGGQLAASSVTKLTVINEAGKDVSPQQFRGVLQDLPYGDYSVRLLIPGFRYWTETVHVDRPITWVTVGMQVGGIEGEPMCGLSGTLIGLKNIYGPVWIRLIELYSNGIIDSEVDSKGLFRIPRASCGKHILAVMIQDNPIRLMTVTLRSSTDPLLIQIGEPQQ